MYKKIFAAVCAVSMLSTAFASSPVHDLMKHHMAIKQSTAAAKNDNHANFSGTWRTDSCGPDQHTHSMDISQNDSDHIIINGNSVHITPLLQSFAVNAPYASSNEIVTAHWNSHRSLAVRTVLISKFADSHAGAVEVGIYKETYSLINSSQMKVEYQSVGLQDLSIATSHVHPTTCIYSKVK